MLIATFHLPPEAVSLEHALRAVPGLEVEAERIAAHSTRWTMPCLWMANAEFAAVDAALADDPTVSEVVETHEFDREKYYQIDWIDDVERRIDAYLDKEGAILEASADSEGWRLKIRFASREQFDAFRDHFPEQDYSFELLDLAESGAPRQTYGELTPDQRDALVAAMEHGYYRVPREISIRELAETLDVSHQAVSELLRRGVANLIESALTSPGEDE